MCFTVVFYGMLYGFITLASPIRVNWCYVGGFPIPLYIISDMIAERMSKKHKEWLVRWKDEDDTWEPLEHISGCKQYIARFEEEHDHRSRDQPSLRCSLSSAYCFLVPSIIARYVRRA